jgi:hypothetical protein
MRAIVGREGMGQPAASSSEMGRFETEWLPSEANLATLTDRHRQVGRLWSQAGPDRWVQ